MADTRPRCAALDCNVYLTPTGDDWTDAFCRTCHKNTKTVLFTLFTMIMKNGGHMTDGAVFDVAYHVGCKTNGRFNTFTQQMDAFDAGMNKYVANYMEIKGKCIKKLQDTASRALAMREELNGFNKKESDIVACIKALGGEYNPENSYEEHVAQLQELLQGETQTGRKRRRI